MDADAVDSFFRESADLLVVLNTDRRIRMANPAFRKTVRGGRPGIDFVDLVPDATRDRVSADLARAAGGATVHVEIEHEDARGERRLVAYRFFPVEGGLVAAIGRLTGDEPAMAEQLGRVADELREKTRILDHIQIELTQVPFIDPVTGVWNRLQVVERLTGEWSRSERYGSPITCLLVEVDGLAEVRGRQGSYAADEVLKSVARRLKRTVRDHDVVGRYAGDRFVVVAVADGEGARSLSLRMRAAMAAEPVAVGERRFPVAVRIGGATNRSEGVEIMEDLFSVAESALEDAKGQADGIRVAEEMGV
jgi:diguanylate cyclase (GGDEF)-like protein